MGDDFTYIPGFGSHVSSEALPDALPKGQNSPQVCPYGLYAEQLSGTAFTAPRAKNQRSWFYRIRPSTVHTAFEGPNDHSGGIPSSINEEFVITPNQLRWSPPAPSADNTTFVEGLSAVCGAGDPSLKEGTCIYNYTCSKNMTAGEDGQGQSMCNADGDFLIVPQSGTLLITTEFGKLRVEPSEICVIARGMKFSVDVLKPVTQAEGVPALANGYICELFTGHFELPGLGPIGANGLANPRDFQAPTAAFEDRDEGITYTIVQKYMGKMFSAVCEHSPYDAVAWHGNYYPYKYDLRNFNTVNSVGFDHPDPSIFTVLTAPTNDPGTAAIDFVIFPPRWMVQEKTFRPPYYHRNCMSEYMGMIHGHYDAKAAGKGGFEPGGASLHSCMSPHGPDAGTFEKASTADLKPVYFDGGLAFMFESSYLLRVAPKALQSPTLQADYQDCWQGLKKNFTGEK